jgi:hypothetical protein
MAVCGPRLHQFHTLEDLSYTPIDKETGEIAEFQRIGILIKCAFCGEERELWKGEDISFPSPGGKVSDTPEADALPGLVKTDYAPEP